MRPPPWACLAAASSSEFLCSCCRAAGSSEMTGQLCTPDSALLPCTQWSRLIRTATSGAAQLSTAHTTWKGGVQASRTRGPARPAAAEVGWTQLRGAGLGPRVPALEPRGPVPHRRRPFSRAFPQIQI